MKKFLYILCLLVVSCQSSDVIKPIIDNQKIKVHIIFEPDDLSISENISDSTIQEIAEDTYYKYQNIQGTYTSNYSILLVEGANTIKSSDNTFYLSINTTNLIVKLENLDIVNGLYPKFKESKGVVDFSKNTFSGDIIQLEVNRTQSSYEATIKIKLHYDSYLVIAPSESLDISKGFSKLYIDSSNQFYRYNDYWYRWIPLDVPCIYGINKTNVIQCNVNAKEGNLYEITAVP